MADRARQNRKTLKRAKIEELFAPDENGFSDWKTPKEVVAFGIIWTTNGNGRRGVYFNYDRCNWEVIRKGGKTTAITKIRMNGWADAKDRFQQNVDASVREHFQRQDVPVCNIAMLPIPEGAVELDHRWGHKEHPTYVTTYQSGQQRHSDFQLLHKAQNVVKRQLCLACVQTGKRPPHPELGYALGDEALGGEVPCRGCYLAEPELYRNVPVSVVNSKSPR